jgi:hypothetical protein
MGADPLSPLLQHAKAEPSHCSKLHNPDRTPRASLLVVDPFVHVAFVDQRNNSSPFPSAVVETMAFATYHVFEGMPASVRLSLLLSLLPIPFALYCSHLEMLRVDCGYIF